MCVHMSTIHSLLQVFTSKSFCIQRNLFSVRTCRLKRNFILRQPVNHYRHISSEVLYNRYRTAGPGGDKLSRIAIGRLVHKVSEIAM